MRKPRDPVEITKHAVVQYTVKGHGKNQSLIRDEYFF